MNGRKTIQYELEYQCICGERWTETWNSISPSTCPECLLVSEPVAVERIENRDIDIDQAQATFYFWSGYFILLFLLIIGVTLYNL